MDRSALRADCSRCAGLCCVAPVLVRGADFALDKPAGVACPHLGVDAGCTVHDRLRPLGMPGCVVFDCFGAGQQVVQVTHRGEDWRDGPQTADRVFAVFGVLRQLHELRWHLTEAVSLVDGPLADACARALATAELLSTGTPEQVRQVDVAGLREDVGELLGQVSTRVRGGVPGRGADRRGADLVGQDLRAVVLRGASLRGALLLGADLQGADLDRTDLLGADLRGADLRGSDLSRSLFVTVAQLEAARGDVRTALPADLPRPAHWPP